MEVKNLLPIGSVILLKKVEKKLMIIGIKQWSEEKKTTHDYIGVAYPEGYINRDIFFTFNHDDIAEVVYEGYISSEQQEFLEKVAEVLEIKR